jgi:hypothetical protein
MASNSGLRTGCTDSRDCDQHHVGERALADPFQGDRIFERELGLEIDHRPVAGFGGQVGVGAEVTRATPATQRASPEW